MRRDRLRRSVSGWKTTAAPSSDGNSWYSQTKISRSAMRNLSLAGADRIFLDGRCPRRAWPQHKQLPAEKCHLGFARRLQSEQSDGEPAEQL